jgi:hypothetical protein
MSAFLKPLRGISGRDEDTERKERKGQKRIKGNEKERRHK